MFRLIKVTGDSLSPSFQEGDYVVVVTLPYIMKKIRRGDIVVFLQPEFGTMIKKVEYLDSDQGTVYVVGTHENSVDSKRFGTINTQALIGKVIWRIPKPLNIK